MPLYTYKAYTDQGKAYFSGLEAPSIQEAKRRLLEKEIQLVRIKEKRSKKDSKIPKSSILSFTKELSQLLGAGLPLYESLVLLKDQFAQDKVVGIISSLCSSLESGFSFSKALKGFPKCFSPLYCTLVAVGEQSGQLDQALNQITLEYERQEKIRKQIQSALLYPSILLVFCVILIHLMILFIIPALEGLFEGGQINAFTKFIIALSHHLKKWEPVYLLILCGATLIGKWKFKSPQVKPFLDRMWLKVPFLNAFLIQHTLAKFSSTMAMLLKGGVPLLESLKHSNSLILNLTLKQAFSQIEKKVEEGHKMSEELKKNPLFPILFSQMIFIGESSGELSQSFDKLGGVYESQVEKKLAKLMTLLSPVILLIMGGIIGFIMLGILIPLTDINSIAI